MDSLQAEVVLSTLSEVYALDDVQEIVDRTCRRVVQICPYRLALLSLYFGEDVYVGLEGGDEEMRESFVRSARAATPEGRARRRNLIWDRHRIDGTNICFLPEEDSEVPLGPSFHPSEEAPECEWRPNDRLMVFVRGADHEIRGVLALDRPTHGRRPDPDNLGELETVDRLITLMGVVIHNKHLAAKLRESEERYAAVVEQAHDGILIEREGRILFANRRMGEMLDTAPALLVNRDVESVLAPESGTTLPGEKEAHLLRPDGRAVDVAVRTSTIRFGGASATLVSVVDITERKRILTQLVRGQKMDSVGTLASGIAHDFNNLLGGILGYASLLKLSLGDRDRSMRYVEAVEKAADRASDVTRQLLGIVRDQETRVAPFPVPKLLAEVAGLLEETLDPSITVTVRCAQDLPDVVGDESQIHQVLLNTSLNARDAMPKGGTLTLEANRTKDVKGRSAVRVIVRDTGSGMDAATLAKVFDPFFTTKKGGAGTGLGLYMAYRVIERHGGSIDISSKPGKGTAVEFVLPSSSEVQRAADAVVERAPEPAGGTILIVDDEVLMRDVGAEMLRTMGYGVVEAANGREAVDKVRGRGGFRCVVLDIAMPVMNGWEAARAIRESHPDLPILLCSGHDVDTALGDTQGIPGVVCLKKPYRLEDLRRSLADAIRGKKAKA